MGRNMNGPRDYTSEVSQTETNAKWYHLLWNVNYDTNEFIQIFGNPTEALSLRNSIASVGCSEIFLGPQYTYF